MQNSKNFRQYAHQLVDWMADYYESITAYPVKSQVKPKDIYQQIPDNAPQLGEDMATIIADFQRIIMPGITHWQHPKFMAYFPANSSYPSVLAEMLMATLGAQCMVWETSPAAAELEEKMMEWLRDMLALPNSFTGVIHDTASTATLCAIISAREKYSAYNVNMSGLQNKPLYRVYCSSQTHSSIEKGAKIAGLGQQNVVKVAVDDDLAIRPAALEMAIQADIAANYKPLCVVVALGTTSTTAIDPLAAIADICTRYNIWLHVDAAYAGSALILPEYRWMAKGMEKADSFVFNPHKWLFTNFDCTAYFVKDVDNLLRTFAILPEYLKTNVQGQVNDYRDWGIPLGRRFRALKLWFVLRNFGIKGLQERLRHHIVLTKQLATHIEQHPQFNLLVAPVLNVLCFRYEPVTTKDLNILNKRFLTALNQSGKVYLTHTKINGMYVIRVVIGQTYVNQQHVTEVWNLIQTTAKCLAL